MARLVEAEAITAGEHVAYSRYEIGEPLGSAQAGSDRGAQNFADGGQ